MISMVEVGSWFKTPINPYERGKQFHGTTECKKCGVMIALTPSAMRSHVELHFSKGELEL
jgi:hypothetical protein